MVGRAGGARRTPTRMRSRPRPPPPPPAETAGRSPPSAASRASAAVTFKRVRRDVAGRLPCWRASSSAASSGCGSVYFVGQDDRGLVTLYRGVPYELPLGHRPLRHRRTSARCRRARCRRSSAAACSTTSCARATTRPTSSAGSSGATSDRPQPRAAGADPGLAAGHGGVHGRVRRAPDASSASASLTYGAIFLGLCLAVHLFIRATLPHADPYLFPLVRAAGRVRPRGRSTASTTTLARQQAGWFVAGIALFALTVAAAARRARAGALPLRDRGGRASACWCCRACPGIGAQVNGAYLGVDIGPLSFQPTEFAKLCIVVFLASYLNERGEALVAGVAARARDDDPAAQALRPAAGRLGRGDADAGLHPRPRQLADVLRRVPRGALRGDRARVVRGRRARAVRARARGSSRARSATCRSASTSGSTRGRTPDGSRLPDRAVAVLAGRRRAVRRGPRQGAAEPPGRRADPARARHRPDLRGDRERGRPVRGGRRRAGLPAVRGARLPRRGARRGRLLEAAGGRA